MKTDPIFTSKSVIISLIFLVCLSCAKRIDLCHEYAGEKEYDKALSECSSVINSGRGTAETYADRGVIYNVNGKYDEALADFNKAVELKPAEAYSNRGSIYLKRKKYAMALMDYKKSIEINPRYAIAYYNIACVYSSMNSSKNACDWLKKAVDLGFNQRDHIRKDPELDNIRHKACYKKIMRG